MPVLNTADAIYLGDTLADAVYLGDMLVWPSVAESWGPGERMLDPAVIPNTTYSGDYTTGVKFTVAADGRITHFCNRNYDTTGTAMFRFYEDIPGMDAGTLLTTLPVPVFYGQQDVPLPTPIEVVAGRTYMLAFYSGPTTHYPYQDGVPVSLSPNLIDMRGTYYAGNTYPTADGNQYYWLDVIYQKQVASTGRDPDTDAFLDASGLDESFAPALDGLVIGLKQAGLWTKMKAVYPFIGGTADLHKWNLIDPRDTDAAYRLTYAVGSGGHSEALGYKPNAAYNSGGGYADTHLTPAGLIDPASAHLSLYSLSPLATGNRCDFGAYNWDGATNRFHLIVHYMSGEFYYSLGNAAMVNTPAGDGSGLFVSSRPGPNSETAYLNGVPIASNTNGGGMLPTVPLHIGHLTGFNSEWSDLPFGFVSIGAGLTDAEVADLNDVVEAYQDALGRGVQTPVWTPATIPGLGLWLEADAIVGVSDGGPVASWTDQGPNHYPVIADPAGPTWRQTGVGGKPSVYFSRSQRLLIKDWGTALSGKSEYTLFVISSSENLGEFPCVITAPTYSTWSYLIEYDSSSDFYWGHSGYWLYDTNFVSGEVALMTFSLPLSGPKFYKNGVLTATSGGSGLTQTVPSLGADVHLGQYYNTSFGMLGHVAAVLWYDHFLIDAERVQVENYLKTKYGIA